MIKKLIKGIIFFIIIIILNNNHNVQASSASKVHLIFNKITYESGEEIKLTINLENFANLSETKIIIKCDENIIIPIKKQNQYGQLLANSIYEEAMLNDYVDNNYLRWQLIKKNPQDGYFSGYKNNIGEFYFLSKDKINNIYEVFQNGNFSTIKTGINISLFDIYNQPINFDIMYSEKIKVEWLKEKYTVEVYQPLNDYLQDIKVLNREKEEYEILVEENINTSTLAVQTINIAIIDKRNSDYLIFSKAVEIVDITVPNIDIPSKINLKSSNLETFMLSTYYVINDNYDLNPYVQAIYYNEENEIIENYNEFINYLNYHQIASIKLIVTDQSNNKNEKLVSISIEDVDPPIVTKLNELSIIDTESDKFVFLDYLTISDNYDQAPLIVYNVYYNNEEVVDYLPLLINGNQLRINYFGIDSSFNTTDEYQCLIVVIDTTIPTIIGPEDIEIIDKEVINYDFSSLFTVTDNIDHAPQIISEFYQIIEEQVLLEEEVWRIMLTKGYEGIIKVAALDKSGNKSSTIKLNVTVKDITPPTIKIENIKDNGKYLKLDKIDYLIYDNFDMPLKTEITLNDVFYDDSPIVSPGNYQLKIIVTDENNNQTIKTINFTIIENNVIGCGDDFNCYIDNYLEVVIIVGLLTIIIVTIFIIRLLKKHH